MYSLYCHVLYEGASFHFVLFLSSVGMDCTAFSSPPLRVSLPVVPATLLFSCYRFAFVSLHLLLVCSLKFALRRRVHSCLIQQRRSSSWPFLAVMLMLNPFLHPSMFRFCFLYHIVSCVDFSFLSSTSFDGEYTIFSDEAEFQSTLSAFLASPDGLRYNTSVVMQNDGSIQAAAIQAEYSGAINGEASKQVKSTPS